MGDQNHWWNLVTAVHDHGIREYLLAATVLLILAAPLILSKRTAPPPSPALPPFPLEPEPVTRSRRPSRRKKGQRTAGRKSRRKSR